MNPKLIAEIIGGIAVAIGFLIFQVKKRSAILLVKLICDVLWCVHFLILGAYTGMVISIVACTREILFARIGNKDGKKPLPLLFVFLILNTCGVVLAWNSIWSICSLISGLLATLAFWQTDPSKIKLFSIFVCASQLTYAIAIGSRSALTNELIASTSIIVFFVRTLWNNRFKKQREQTADVENQGL